MSLLRRKSQVTNSHVYLQNRLTTFTNPPMHTGNLYVENNENVSGNLGVSKNMNVFGNFGVTGNLTVGNNLTTSNCYATGNYFLNNYVLIPAGTIIQSAAINAPSGWFDCDGRRLNTIAYIDLFNAIMYTYGGSDTSFNVPDIRGRFSIGLGSGTNLTPHGLGSIGGEENHTLTISEMPSHTHSLTRRSNPDAGAFDTGNGREDESSAATTDRADLGPFNTNSTGSDASHNNMPPFISLRYLIKY